MLKKQEMLIMLPFFLVLSLSANLHAEKHRPQRWSFAFENISVKDALLEIREQAGIEFYIDETIVQGELSRRTISKLYHNKPLDKIITDIFRNDNCAMTWSYRNKRLSHVRIWIYAVAQTTERLPSKAAISSAPKINSSVHPGHHSGPSPSSAGVRRGSIVSPARSENSIRYGNGPKALSRSLSSSNRSNTNSYVYNSQTNSSTLASNSSDVSSSEPASSTSYAVENNQDIETASGYSASASSASDGSSSEPASPTSYAVENDQNIETVSPTTHSAIENDQNDSDPAISSQLETQSEIVSDDNPEEYASVIYQEPMEETEDTDNEDWQPETSSTLIDAMGIARYMARCLYVFE